MRLAEKIIVKLKKIKSMKKAIVLLAVAAVMCGCSKTVIENEDIVNVSDSKRVRFDVSNKGWQVVTRSLDADGQEMTDLWLFDYMNGELVKTVHKVQGDADIATPSVELKYGEHHIYFVASRGKNPEVSGTTIVWGTPSDTFWKEMTLSIDGKSATSVAVALDRVVTKLRISVNDKVPEGTASVAITPGTWWYGLDYTTGAAIDSRQDERVISVPSSFAGTTGQLVLSMFGLSDDDEWTTGLTITAKNGSGDILGQVQLDDVPFLRNRATEASGSLFGNTSTFSITLNNEWLEPYTLEW